MSAKATFWAWEVDVANVHQRAVLLCLADCHNGDNGRCDPSVNYIARRTQCDRKTVMKVIAELEKSKLIKSSKRQGTSTQYTLLTSTTDGTSTTNGTGTTDGTEPVPPAGHPPVPPVVPKPKRESKKNLKQEYAFAGETVKINQKDFDAMGKQYPNLDLFSELPQLDLELRGQRNWWGALHAKLNYRNKSHAKNQHRGNTPATRKLSAVERVRQRCGEIDRELSQQGDA